MASPVISPTAHCDLLYFYRGAPHVFAFLDAQELVKDDHSGIPSEMKVTAVRESGSEETLYRVDSSSPLHARLLYHAPDPWRGTQEDNNSKNNEYAIPHVKVREFQLHDLFPSIEQSRESLKRQAEESGEQKKNKEDDDAAPSVLSLLQKRFRKDYTVEAKERKNDQDERPEKRFKTETETVPDHNNNNSPQVASLEQIPGCITYSSNQVRSSLLAVLILLQQPGRSPSTHFYLETATNPLDNGVVLACRVMPTCVSNLFGDAYKEPFLFSVKDTCEKINQNDKTATSGKIDVHCGTKLRLEFGDNCQNYNANRFSFSTFDKEDERKTVSYDNITHFLTDAVLETLFRFTVGVTVEKDKGGETVYDWKDIFNVGERHNDEKWSFVVTSSFVKKQKDVLLKKSFLLLKFLSHFSYVYCIGEVLLRQKEKSGHATKLKGHLRFCISDQQMKSIVSICDEKDSNNALCEVYVTDSNAQVEWSSEAGKARRNGSVVDLLNSV